MATKNETKGALQWLFSVRFAIVLALFIASGMSATWAVALLILFFISGAPLFTIMIAAAILGALSLPRDFDSEFDGMVANIIGLATGDQAQVMSTIPLFIYAGYLLAEAKTADRLVRFANALLGWMPGGLAIVTIGTCALFTVFTGASGVTIIALGGVLMPALVRNGYPERFSMGLIAGTGSVGLLFPPALPLFIYGTIFGLTEKAKDLGWDTRRFLFAGIVPGLVLIGMLSVVAIAVAISKKLPRQRFDIVELGKSFLVALPELFVPFGVILGLGLGIGLSEIAALTVLYVVILEVAILRMVTLKTLWSVSREAMAMVGAIFIIIIGSTVLTNFMVTAQVPQKLIAWTQDHVESKIIFLLAINVILLIVGTVMDIFSAIVVVLPLIAPIAYAYGIDPYHLGVIFLLNLEVGYLHPPVGLNLFLTSVKFQRPITEVMWATVPFLITMIIALLTITYVPALTIVPEPERTAPVTNLVNIAENGIEEAKVVIAQLKLVDQNGNELKDAKGQPIIRKFVDCAKQEKDDLAKLAKAGPNDKPKGQGTIDQEKEICTRVFLQVTKCAGAAVAKDVAALPPKEKTCAWKAIAKWTAEQINGETSDQEQAVIVSPDVPLVGKDGKPLVKDDYTFAKKDGTPIVKKIGACPPLKPDGKASFEREGCRALFVAVSNCRITSNDEDLASCADKCKSSPTLPDCVKACETAVVDTCVAKAIDDWVGEHTDDAKKE